MRKPNTRVPANDGGDALLTIKEIAELDRCSEKTVRRAIDSGLLEAIRIGPGGRLLRVRRAAHEAYRRLRAGDALADAVYQSQQVRQSSGKGRVR